MEFRSAGASLHQAVSLPEGYKRPTSSQLRPAFAVRALRAFQSLLFSGLASSVDLLVTTVTGPTANDPVGFDAYLYLGFAGWNTDRFISALVDSGNTTLIVPRWEDIAAIPNWQNLYSILGQATEPWGCPAHVVKGPIQIETADGQSLTIPDCEFYACFDNSPQSGARTSNFGAGCLKVFPSYCNARFRISPTILLQSSTSSVRRPPPPRLLASRRSRFSGFTLQPPQGSRCWISSQILHGWHCGLCL
jgi:hypothetical protein